MLSESLPEMTLIDHNS